LLSSNQFCEKCFIKKALKDNRGTLHLSPWHSRKRTRMDFFLIVLHHRDQEINYILLVSPKEE